LGTPPFLYRRTGVMIGHRGPSAPVAIIGPSLSVPHRAAFWGDCGPPGRRS